MPLTRRFGTTALRACLRNKKIRLSEKTRLSAVTSSNSISLSLFAFFVRRLLLGKERERETDHASGRRSEGPALIHESFVHDSFALHSFTIYSFMIHSFAIHSSMIHISIHLRLLHMSAAKENRTARMFYTTTRISGQGHPERS